jgi:hypothetical protein
VIFVDSNVFVIALRHARPPATETFVSWDARHFEGELPTRVVTPRQFLEDEV